MEDLTQVITAAQFHPVDCNLLMYSSSKGTIGLTDTRQGALCDAHAQSKRPPPIYLATSTYAYHAGCTQYKSSRNNQTKLPSIRRSSPPYLTYDSQRTDAT